MSKKKQISLINEISSLFDEESQIEENSLSVAGENISIFYIESLIDKKLFSEGVLAPIEKIKVMIENHKVKTENKNLSEVVKEQFVSISSVEEISDSKEAFKKIFSGFAVVAFSNIALCCPIYGVSKRSIAEPPTSRVVKGPREGFVEDIYTNIGLVRKRIKSETLKIKDLFIGKKSNTQISIFYLEDVVDHEVLKEVERRLSLVDIDAIIDSYYVESFLETDKIKFFRRVGNTEKPDIFCSKILEGRVGILVDGSPIALTVPFVLLEDLQSPQDYYTIPSQASFLRLMRFVGLAFAILIPGIYVALQSFNYRILPINFLISILNSIEGLSVPPLVELLVVLFLFEVITEASQQMPNALGMALSIIGALALGNTAVDAGIISPPSIVIVAISSVAIYIIPDQIAETRLLRILFTVIGGVVGLYGIITGFIILTTYLTSITSFGVPYLAPFAPNIKRDHKDGFVKQSIQAMDSRPVLFAGKNKTRQAKVTEKNNQEIEKQEQILAQKNHQKTLNQKHKKIKREGKVWHQDSFTLCFGFWWFQSKFKNFQVWLLTIFQKTVIFWFYCIWL